MSGPGRNAPCPCGSGKKFKRCCFNRKPLSHVVGVELETPQALKGAQMEPDGTITFLYANEGVRQKRAWVTTYRERKKGQKTLIQADMNPDQLMFGEIHLREYDFVFAIDTNNRRIKGTAVSAAHVMQLRFKSENEVEQSVHSYLLTCPGDKKISLGSCCATRFYEVPTTSRTIPTQLSPILIWATTPNITSEKSGFTKTDCCPKALQSSMLPKKEMELQIN